jgi:single-strand DNA-binding protein
MNRGLNKVMLIGWIDGSIELRHTASGRPVASFTVATPRSWQSAEGEQHEETEWFNIVAWGSLAEICSKRLKTGQQLYLEGRLQTRGWEDENGKMHFRTEVIAQEVVGLENRLDSLL